MRRRRRRRRRDATTEDYLALKKRLKERGHLMDPQSDLEKLSER